MKKITSLAFVAALMGTFATQSTFAQYDLDPDKEIKDLSEVLGTDDINKERVIVEEISEKPIKDGDGVFFVVEQKPQFPGGEAALVNWLKANIQYPVAQEEVAQGRVVVQFIVEKDGSIGEAKVARSCHPALDAEAVRVVKNLPKFEPAQNDGQAVRCWFTLPLSFRLSDDKGDSNNDEIVLSQALGVSMGGGITESIKSIPDSAYRAKMSKEKIFSGIEYVLSIDTANVSKITGLYMSSQYASRIMQFEEQGVKINRDTFLKEFKTALMSDSVASEKLMEYNDYLGTIFNQFSNDSVAVAVNGDSVSIAMGVLFGGDIADQINRIPDSNYRAKISKNDIYEVLEYVISMSTEEEGKLAGVSLGLQLFGQVKQLEMLGASINRNVLYNALKSAFFSETLSTADIEFSNNYIENTYKKLQEEAEKKYVEERANSPEATYNKLEEEKFMANLKKNDKKVKFTESGVGYKIIKKGKGSAIANETSIEVAYKGSLIDGTVFDDSEGQYIEFNLDGVVPGFADGLRALKKGDKAILYIPGALAYGVMGQPAAGIEPNQMLIFEVEIKDSKK